MLCSISGQRSGVLCSILCECSIAFLSIPEDSTVFFSWRWGRHSPQPLPNGMRRHTNRGAANGQSNNIPRDWFSLVRYLSTASTTVCPLLRGLRRERLSAPLQPQPLAQGGLRRFSLFKFGQISCVSGKKAKKDNCKQILNCMSR